MTMQCVKFVAKAGKYNAGDVAGFRPHDAKRYVDAGKAINWDPNPPVAAKPAEKAPEADKSEESKSGYDKDLKSGRAAKRRVRAMEAEGGKGYETKDE